ncbi:DUF1289 domain-containing protein [Actimicrobium antarcticum]|uniref:DUF1289 domain-containing protein n=1 Tax=Actimicrobium antarcticum TaxID=1051899 RepID=A0ABP7T6Y1_9BURK
MSPPASPPTIRFDPVATTGPAPSPCISVCQMDTSTDLCIGCQRTIPEIMAWGSATEGTRRAIWRAINARRNATPHG